MTNDEKLMQQALDALEKLASQTPTTHVRAGKAQFDGKEHIALWFDDCSDPIQQATYINATKPEKLKEFLRLVRARLAQPDQLGDITTTWQNAALRLGEELSTVGPDGYYNMTAKQWLDWAMDQQPHGKNSLTAPPQREWQGLTDEEFDGIVPYCHNEFDLQEYSDFARAIEAKLKEKNT